MNSSDKLVAIVFILIVTLIMVGVIIDATLNNNYQIACINAGMNYHNGECSK